MINGRLYTKSNKPFTEEWIVEYGGTSKLFFISQCTIANNEVVASEGIVLTVDKVCEIVNAMQEWLKESK